MSPGGTGINFGGTVNSAETASLDAVAVVIPVHNEEQHVERALEAVRAAVDFLKARRPGIDARVMVVLDACTDNSGFLARRFAAADPRFIVMDAAFRCVGKSRRAGIEALWDGPCDAGSAVPACLWGKPRGPGRRLRGNRRVSGCGLGGRPAPGDAAPARRSAHLGHGQHACADLRPDRGQGAPGVCGLPALAYPRTRCPGTRCPGRLTTEAGGKRRKRGAAAVHGSTPIAGGTNPS